MIEPSWDRTSILIQGTNIIARPCFPVDAELLSQLQAHTKQLDHAPPPMLSFLAGDKLAYRSDWTSLPTCTTNLLLYVGLPSHRSYDWAFDLPSSLLPNCWASWTSKLPTPWLGCRVASLLRTHLNLLGYWVTFLPRTHLGLPNY